MMRDYRALSVIACLAFAIPSICGSSVAETRDRGSSWAESDERFREVLDLALRNISRGRCGDDKPCQPATESELNSPPVLMEHARKAARTGVLSAIAERCGVDSDQRLFLPMMAHFRRSVRLGERQLAILALVHGIELARTSKGLRADACTSQISEHLSQSLKGS